jgi:hypothetical protein
MAAPLKIFGTAFALTLGAWRLQLRIDLDEVTDDAEETAPPVTSRRNYSDMPSRRISMHRP